MNYREAFAAYEHDALPIEIANQLPLIAGVGSRSDGCGLCAMQVAAWIAGERHSDHPKCVSRVLSDFVIELNDYSEITMRLKLRERFAALINTADGRLEDARLLSLFRSAVANMTESFITVSAKDRALLGQAVEGVAVALHDAPLEYIRQWIGEVVTPSYTLIVGPGTNGDVVLDQLELIVMAAQTESDWSASASLGKSLKTADQHFGTDWRGLARSDPTKPGPGTRALAALDTAIGIISPNR